MWETENVIWSKNLPQDQSKSINMIFIFLVLRYTSYFAFYVHLELLT